RPMETRKVCDLKPHPENAKVYGDDPDEKLIESVRKKGVIFPLLITKGNVIIGGHRRCLAAKLVGLEEVPVTVFPSEDELDVVEAMVDQNMYREVKSTEMLAREAQLLLRVEKERAQRRRRATQNNKAAGAEVETVPPQDGEQGKARDVAGEKLGV